MRAALAGVLLAFVLSTGGSATAELNPALATADAVQPARYLEATKEFINGAGANSLEYYSNPSNSGGASFSNTAVVDPAHPGIGTFSTGAGGGGARAEFGLANFSTAINFGTAKLTCEMVARIPILSTAGEQYEIGWGFDDWTTTGDTAVDGVWLYYTHGTNSGNWQLIARNNGGAGTTTVNTTTPPPVNTWFRQTIVVNAAGTSASAYQDGVLIGTVTGLPTGPTRTTAFQFRLEKNTGMAGTTARTVDVDYFSVRVEASR